MLCARPAGSLRALCRGREARPPVPAAPAIPAAPVAGAGQPDHHTPGGRPGVCPANQRCRSCYPPQHLRRLPPAQPLHPPPLGAAACCPWLTCNLLPLARSTVVTTRLPGCLPARRCTEGRWMFQTCMAPPVWERFSRPGTRARAPPPSPASSSARCPLPVGGAVPCTRPRCRCLLALWQHPPRCVCTSLRVLAVACPPALSHTPGITNTHMCEHTH